MAQENAMNRRRPTVLVVLSGGGFTFETKCLLRSLGEDVDFIYVSTRFGGLPGEGGLPAGERHEVPMFQTVSQRSVRQSLYAFLATFFVTARLLWRRKVDLVVGVGCSHTVPLFLAGCLFWKRRVFIESITRVNDLSDTGKLVYFCRLASVFLVQWPTLSAKYPHSRVGTVL
ncbi:MAG TPA: hypothetical protein VM689_09740 [Aliidongia sp.]|nr:hypothetical protein [Aliidongia sp.]